MTSQSLPPPDTVNDSLHLLDIGGQETAAHWDADNRLWFPLGAYSFDVDLPFDRTKARYLCPVPSAAQISSWRAIEKAARDLFPYLGRGESGFYTAAAKGLIGNLIAALKGTQK